MNISIDFGFRSINHYGEEVCGDRVEHKRREDGFLGVLADGMGSGVKANILSTMGTKLLPERPIFRSSLSITNATRAI